MNTISQKARDTFAKNLRDIMARKGVTQKDIAQHFNITTSIVSDWCNAKKYPRVDKMQMLADYFDVLKSDLTEDKTERTELDDYLEGLRTRPEMKMLFNITKNATKEEVEKAVKIIETMLND